MNKEIDISKVPLTPQGKNHDFRSVKNYEFVRFDEIIKVRTTALVSSDKILSDSEVDLNSFETDEEKVSALVKSPMIEVRKRKSLPAKFNSNNDIRINPERRDLLETSEGCLVNYKKSRRMTMDFLKRTSEPGGTTNQNHSVSQSDLDVDKENLTEEELLDKELTLLVGAVDHSVTYMNNEKIRLNEMINNWSHILEQEENIPAEIQGDIKSVIGGVQILLNKRFESTFQLLNLAETYVNNNGVLVEEGDKHYRSEDIFAFVDLLLAEIKKIDLEFTTLLNQRSRNWIEEEPRVNSSLRRKSMRKKKVVLTNAKKVKSRIDLVSLRKKFGKAPHGESEEVEIFSRRSERRESKEIDSSSDKINKSQQHKTPTFKKGIRSKSILKSSTGTPVHNDTPRPRRSAKIVDTSSFVMPSLDKMATKKNRKRSTAETQVNNGDDFTLPAPVTKRSRKSGSQGK